MSKSVKITSTSTRPTGRGIPLVVLVGLIGLGLVGYVLSQAFLPPEAHPSHWLVALISAIVGGVLGWLWYRWRGDII